MSWAIVVFFLTLALTYGVALYARLKARHSATEEDLAGRGLSRWLVGLSAGTTGNSGFIVTAAVGLGYSGGVQWLMLPLAWLLGDLVFWKFFPGRLNDTARRSGATTLSELLSAGMAGWSARAITIVVALLLLVFLSTYTAAQWLAGEKFLSSIFEMSKAMSLATFGLTIVLYSSLGGFRGGIYTDTVQAVIRVLGTVIALGAAIWFALENQALFATRIAAAGPAFLQPFPGGSLLGALGFVFGYAGAAIGFGLGQPQIVSRYLAGASPEETRAAQWIYIGFLQGTWLSMTLFGILLRGLMPALPDPETGLSVFVQSNLGAIATGIIFADVFATIASTSNGILVAIGQLVRRDLLGPMLGERRFSLGVTSLITFGIGMATIALSFVLPGNVFSIAVDSVSKVGAGLAGPVMIKLFGWRHTGPSLLAAILLGIAAGFAWKLAGYGGVLNEAGVGIATSLLCNWLLTRRAAETPMRA